MFNCYYIKCNNNYYFWFKNIYILFLMFELYLILLILTAIVSYNIGKFEEQKSRMDLYCKIEVIVRKVIKYEQQKKINGQRTPKRSDRTS